MITRSNPWRGASKSRRSATTHSISTPRRSARSRALSMATREKSTAVTFQRCEPDRVAAFPGGQVESPARFHAVDLLHEEVVGVRPPFQFGLRVALIPVRCIHIRKLAQRCGFFSSMRAHHGRGAGRAGPPLPPNGGVAVTPQRVPRGAKRPDRPGTAARAASNEERACEK